MPDAERTRLAALGVPLFDVEPRGAASLDHEEYAGFLARLMRSGDARLRACVPCLLAVHDGQAAARAVRQALLTLPADNRRALALLYRVARCLVRSRAPDLRFLLKRPRELPPIAEEPAEVPDPALQEGELGLAVASDLAREGGVADLAGDAADLFDTWLKILHVQHEPA